VGRYYFIACCTVLSSGSTYAIAVALALQLALRCIQNWDVVLFLMDQWARRASLLVIGCRIRAMLAYATDAVKRCLCYCTKLLTHW